MNSQAPAPQPPTETAPANPLFQPLAGESPTGPDLAAAGDMLFDQIQEARRADDDLPQGIWKIKRKRADWKEVEQICRDALCQRTKDLRLMGWMTEARVQQDGFQALAPAFQDLQQFCEAFWAGMHPGIEEDGDLTARVNALMFLDHHLPEILTVRPLTRSGVATPVQYSWGDFETAELYRRKGLKNDEIPSSDDILNSAAQTPPQNFYTLKKDIFSAQQSIADLDAYLNRVCGRQAPSFAGLKLFLENILGWIHTVLPEAEVLPEPAANPLPEEANGEIMTEETADRFPAAPQPQLTSGAVKNRDEAYRRISEIADFLEQGEPHSPVPYVLRRVCSWKNKPLPDILAEIADGSDSLTPILKLFAKPQK